MMYLQYKHGGDMEENGDYERWKNMPLALNETRNVYVDGGCYTWDELGDKIHELARLLVNLKGDEENEDDEDELLAALAVYTYLHQISEADTLCLRVY